MKRSEIREIEAATSRIKQSLIRATELDLFYTSCGHGCGFYSELFLLESKALKQAHSKLCNCFSNAAIGQKQPIENRSLGRAKYIYPECKKR